MNPSIRFLLALFFIACIADFFLISKWQIYKAKIKEQVSVDLNTSNKLLIFRQVFYDDTKEYWRNSFLATIARKIKLLTIFEFLTLAFWAIYIGREYLNMDPRIIPTGGELGSAISSNHMWTQFLKCGWCATWNGFQRGGYPAFADIQGSMLHPLVIVSTLLFGVINGVKITLVISLWIAGIAQWWIARELDLSWVPRMWSAGIAIAGGHLASRMELGVPGVVLATATTSLVFAALIRLANRNTRADAILLGICTASAIVSGQGYIQVGLIAVLPVYMLFYWGRENFQQTWNNYLIAATAAFLLAAPFLIPLLHFSPNIVKDFDPQFKAAQPIAYFVLNLLIDDWQYYNSTVMMKYPYPYLYSLYIGWIPVMLFIYSLSHGETRFKKIVWFMIAGIITEFLVGSAVILKLLVPFWPTVAGIRHSPQITGLAVPFILGISAYGLENLIKLQWTIRGKVFASSLWIKQWIVIIPLVYSLQSCAHFASYWIRTTYLNNDVFLTLENLSTDNLQWINPPFGEHQYIEPAIEMGMKLSPGILTWNWRDRTRPFTWMEAERSSKTKMSSNIIFKTHPEYIYASIKRNHGISACQATGSGGNIQVQCNSDEPGVLHVQENMWTGWYAWVDGNKVDLIGNQRLMVNIPAGKHAIIFRYLPWDVPLGLLLFFIGVFYCLRQWTLTERPL